MGRVGKYGELSRGAGVQVLFCFQLISSVDPKFLKLTKIDDDSTRPSRKRFCGNREKFGRNLGEWLPREIIGMDTENQESPGKIGRVGKHGETPRGTGVQVLFCFQLISSVDPKFLKLTKMDDEIYASFKEAFGWKFRRNLGEWLPREIIGRGTEIQESPGKMGRVGKYGETSRGAGVQVLFYFQLISSVDPKFLKLTKMDDEIYSSFKETFKHLDLKLLNPDDLKSAEAKEKWRPFCNQYEGQVEDFNYGTLLRLDCGKDYTDENTIFTTRIQFFAIEIARNREGFNDAVFSSRSSKS